MFAVLVGVGPNDLLIPALIFSSLDVALQKCKSIMGESDESEFAQKILKETGGKYFWNYEEELNDRENSRLFYTRYYGGAGFCYGFVLKEVEEGEPFVPWDLD